MSSPPALHGRTAALAAVAAALAGLALAAMRLHGSASLSAPLQVITSGVEQQTLYEIWRFVHGLPVYADSSKLPYYSSFYNWLFYEAFGLWTKAGLHLLGLDEAWLPTVGRCFNLLAAVLGIFAVARLLERLGGLDSRAGLMVTRAFAVSLCTGPLVGFWIFTLRPDLWALLLEVLAVLAFWSQWRTRIWRALLMAAVFCYLAWGFKQANVFAAGAIGLFLLSERRIGPALVFAGLLGGAWALTFVLAPPWYLPSMVQVALGFIRETGLRNIANFTVKSLPQLLPLAVLAAAALRHGALGRALWADHAFRLGFLGSLVALGLAGVGVFKEGASESYFLAAAVFLAATTLAGWRTASAQGRGGVIGQALAAGWGMQLAAVLLVLTGIQGVTSVRGQHERHTRAQACMAGLPVPILASEQYLQLPWINPSRPEIFPSYNYPIERAAGRAFERGGLGGLVAEGYFAALLLTDRPDSLDGTPLGGRYQPDETACPGFVVFRRRP